MTTTARAKPGSRSGSKSERLEARVSAELKELIQRAADLEGVTLSDFLISTLVARSRSTIREHEVITLSGRNRDVFLAALQSPPSISPKFAAAFQQLKDLQDGVAPGAVAGETQPGGVQKRKRSA